MLVSVYRLFSVWMTHRGQEERALSGSMLLFWWMSLALLGVLLLLDHTLYPIVDTLSSAWPYNSQNFRSFKSKGFAIAFIPIAISLLLCGSCHLRNWRQVARRRGTYRDLWKIFAVLFGSLLLLGISYFHVVGALLAMFVNALGFVWLARVAEGQQNVVRRK